MDVAPDKGFSTLLVTAVIVDTKLMLKGFKKGISLYCFVWKINEYFKGIIAQRIFIKRCAVIIIKQLSGFLYLVYMILQGIPHLWWRIRILSTDVDDDILKWRHF